MVKTSHIFLILILSTFSTIISSQINDASIVIGLESNYLLFSVKSDSKPIIGSVSGLMIQKPLGQFSVGVGFLNKDYRELYNYREATGETKRELDYVYYFYDKIVVEPEYYSFATRLYYRLPCNCLYFFGGFEVDFLKEGKLVSKHENYSYTFIENIDSEYEIVPVKKKVYNLNFGVGLNFPITQRLRFFTRPSVVISQKLYSPESEIPKHKKENPLFVHLSIGMEYGIGTYN